MKLNVLWLKQLIINTESFWIVGNTLFYSGVSQCHATSGGTAIFIATFTAGYIPPTADSFGKCGNFDTGISGNSWTQSGQNNIIRMAKYDATAIATNSQYFGATGFYKF